MTTILIKNIKTIIGYSADNIAFKKGVQMAEVGELTDAYIIIKGDKIAEIGLMSACPKVDGEVIEATGRLVMPTWCDSHTHIVFAAGREEEFEARLRGESYESIATNGGGILNSALKLQQMSQDELYHHASARLENVISCGTGAIEIKSGYGLTLESELKMLRVIRRLKQNYPVAIKATFLGAHAIPSNYKNDRKAYIALIIDEMLPAVVAEGLADYCDVFCDHGFFTVEETDQILKAAKKLGLKPKIHANELANSGGVQIGIANNAISVDHLEAIDQAEIDALLASDTIPTVLPFVSFFLNIQYAPARKMIDQGLGITIASDYNPGSSPSGNIPLLMAHACNGMRLVPNEAFNAVTINGAYAMELQDQLGTITVGKTANIIITKPINSLAYLVYAFGQNHIEKVILQGKVMGNV